MQAQQQVKCAIVGATGATGSIITKLLSSNPHCDGITSIGRKAYPVPLPKLVNVAVDFEKGLNQSHFEGHDSCIITLGANVSAVGFEVRSYKHYIYFKLFFFN